MADRVGQQLGNYRLIRLLGKGGFAEVYLGEHVRLGTQTAIKVLHARLVENDEVERFQQEASTIAHLEHPHIVRVLDFDVQEGTPFLIMGYAPNGNLRQRHPRGIILPFSTIVNYLKQIADALQWAHEHKVIHRDIKPENMLLGRHHEILLSDFGIALLAQSSRLQSTQEVAGTASYMAPEQLQGKPRLASDQYALGIVVYEWLCGMRPFEGSFSEIASQHVLTPPPSLCERVPTILPEVEYVVLTALQKDPHKRFGSVQAFATALEQACQGTLSSPGTPALEIALPSEPMSPNDQAAEVLLSQLPLSTNIVTPPSQSLEQSVAAISPTTAAMVPPFAKEPVPSSETQPSRHHLSRRAVIGGIAGLTVIGGGIVWLIGSHSSSGSFVTSTPTAPSTPTEPPRATPTLSITLVIYHGHSDAINWVTWSPDGRRIASASWDKTVQVWNAADGGNAYTYRGHSGGVLGVSWSPDGKRIASGSDDKTVQVWNAANGGNAYTYRGHSNIVYALAWSPDGKRIASGSDDKTVQVWNAANGGNAYTYRGHSENVDGVAWSPDGKRIASASFDKTVQVWQAP